MIKRFIACLFVLLLLVPGAYAQDYVPGDISHTLFADAFARGDMLLMDAYFGLSFNEKAEELLGSDMPTLNAWSEALKHSAFSFGAGKTDGGIRLLAAGQYVQDDRQAMLDMLLEITQDGLSLTSSAIPGERVSASWPTLLSMTGLTDEEVAQFMELCEMDVPALLSELATEAESAAELLAQIAAPYGETILAHIAALPMDVLTDVPAESGFPAAAMEIQITISDQAVRDLLVALADQLEADATLCAIFDAALAETDEEMTTAQFCQIVRQNAEKLISAKSTPIEIFFGMDEAGSPLYLSISKADITGSSVLFSAVITADAETALNQLSIDLLSLSAADEIEAGVRFCAVYPQTPADAQAKDLQLYLDLYESGRAVFSMESAQTDNAMALEGAPEARTETFALGLATTAGDDDVTLMCSAQTLQSKTADGGEQASIAGSVELASGDIQIPMEFESYILTENAADAPTAVLASSYKAPALGIDEYTEEYALYTVAYDADDSAFTEYALETASAEDLDALLQRAMASLKNTQAVLLELLPTDLIKAYTQP